MDDPLRLRFSTSLPLSPQMEPHLREALEQVLTHPGSLARPRLLLQIAEAYGVRRESAEELATAVEYFHTASLLIDDLPCMDDAYERRSMPCLHLKFGEATTILASLALVNRAYLLSWRAIAGSGEEAGAKALEYLEARLGVEGLLHGQSLDLRYSAVPSPPHEARKATERIAIGKTVSLIRMALVLPALVGDAPAEDVRELERIAHLWGVGYQMIDDLKDVLHETGGATLRAASGKTPGRDKLLGRPNAVHAMGLSAALDRLDRVLRLADRPLETLLARRPALMVLRALRATLRCETATLHGIAQPMLWQEIA